MKRESNMLSMLNLCIVFVVCSSIVSAYSLDGETELPQRDDGPLVTKFRDMMSVRIPMFYDMIKNGNSMGINVLSGLVKVERGQEAERSGLSGPRPLSVRIFGVPIYERGRRFRNPEPEPESPLGGRRKVEQPSEDDELPIIT